MAPDETSRPAFDSETAKRDDLAPSRETVAPRSAAGRQARPVSFWHRAAFWRAVAGIAISLALAAGFLAAEFSNDLISRTRTLKRRLGKERTAVRRLEATLKTAQEELALAGRKARAAAAFEEILLAPDLRIIRLRSSVGTSGARGFVASSSRLRNTVLRVSGLPAAPAGSVYVWWWVRVKGAPLKAGQFDPATARELTVVPTSPFAIRGAGRFLVTLEEHETRVPHGPKVLVGRVGG